MHHFPKFCSQLWACVLQLWSQSEPFFLSSSSSSQAELVVMCDIGFLHKFAFNSCSSSKSLVLHSGMFVHSFMAVVTTFQTNKLYPLLQLDSCNGEEKCSLMNWFPSRFCGSRWDFFLTLRESRAESPSHNSSAAWLCLVHSWGEKGWTPLLNSSSI